jgi:hypothetical protein
MVLQFLDGPGSRVKYNEATSGGEAVSQVMAFLVRAGGLTLTRASEVYKADLLKGIQTRVFLLSIRRIRRRLVLYFKLVRGSWYHCPHVIVIAVFIVLAKLTQAFSSPKLRLRA